MPEFLARYEFKYLITEKQADFIRDAVTMYCEPDAYGDNGNYEVCSLYYDTWDWKLAMGTVAGDRNRFKIRIRTYGWTDDMPVFAENKGRVGDSIVKSRALIPREHWALLSNSEPPPPEGFVAKVESHQSYYDSFRNIFDIMDMRPRLWVSYMREAFGSRYGDGARLTFDRFLRVQAPNIETPAQPDDAMWQTVRLDGHQTILEMKFNGAFPDWMRFLVHTLELKRVSCSKYVQGVEQIGDAPWNRVEWSDTWTVF
ncbi:MAG: VTC domain-containing protein [Rhodobacterales bacterium]|nr:VTC domain-containing protein [Rhodobacterales bacterium]